MGDTITVYNPNGEAVRVYFPGRDDHENKSHREWFKRFRATKRKKKKTK